MSILIVVLQTPSDAAVKPVIENELNFLAVNSTLLPYDSLSIYLARKKPERVLIAQGSGYYEITVSEAGIVNVDLDDQTKELVITPLRIGHVSFAMGAVAVNSILRNFCLSFR